VNTHDVVYAIGALIGRIIGLFILAVPVVLLLRACGVLS